MVKIVQEGKPQWKVATAGGCTQSAVRKFWCKSKRNRWLKKENILVHIENHQDVRIGNSKKMESLQ